MGRRRLKLTLSASEKPGRNEGLLIGRLVGNGKHFVSNTPSDEATPKNLVEQQFLGRTYGLPPESPSISRVIVYLLSPPGPHSRLRGPSPSPTTSMSS